MRRISSRDKVKVCVNAEARIRARVGRNNGRGIHGAVASAALKVGV
jgi:hypothetical protein